jgi:hypothetical protein
MAYCLTFTSLIFVTMATSWHLTVRRLSMLAMCINIPFAAFHPELKFLSDSIYSRNGKRPRITGICGRFDVPSTCLTGFFGGYKCSGRQLCSGNMHWPNKRFLLIRNVFFGSKNLTAYVGFHNKWGEYTLICCCKDI